MSKDIRSFFQLKKVQKVKVEDDDDVIPESPDVQIKTKKKESRKKRVLSDSDDEEIFTSKKKKPDTAAHKSTKNSKSPKKPLKEVKVIDLFGSAPIKRTEPLVKKEKTKKNTETGIHSDDDFDKSLLELDAVEESALDTGENASASSVNNIIPKGDIPNSTSTGLQDEIKVEKSKKSSSDNKEVKNKDEKIKIEKEKSPSNEHRNDKDIKEDKNKKETKMERKSKLDSKAGNEKKKKFAEFIENETIDTSDKSEEETSSKKKKLNESHSEKPNKIKEVKKELVSDTNDSDCIEDSQMNQSIQGSKKKKLNKSLNDSVLTDEERHERRRQSAALYKNYLNRSGPKHLGAKEIPEGAPDCLKDCAFLLTGVLDSFEREEVTDAIIKYGGCIKNSISKKVTHVLAGEEAGPAKMAKASELGIKIIGEDDFIKMIKDSTSNGPDKKEIKKEKTPSKPTKELSKQSNGINKKKDLDSVNKNKSDQDKHKIKHEKINGFEIKDKKIKSPDKVDIESKPEKKMNKKSESQSRIKEESKIKIEPQSTKHLGNDVKSKSSDSIETETAAAMMWVDKYKPQNLKQIIGQHGDASNVKKLSNWLTKWYVNRKAKLPKPSPWAKNDDGGFYKAALLSGPPGVGKTTTVALVCKELGFDMVEFNASDTRSKNLIKEQISELLTTTSLSAYAKGDTGKQAVTKKHVLVMDEVDGMAGNEDRGGLQELIGLIKSTSVPIVCMCNDRNSQKMRSLVNYCYDLRFTRPRVDQIKSAMMSICFKEGLKIPPDALTQLIVAANQDVRQTLHLLSMWAAEPDPDKMKKDSTSVRKDIKLIVAANQDVRQTLHLLSMWAAEPDPDKMKKDSTSVRKDIKLGPWEAIRKVFSAEDHKTMSINDKSDLFFYDYSLAPLFVQENYLQVSPHCPKNELLDRISKAADSISAGDLVDARIRGKQAWSLLPVQAMYSSVIPGHYLSGHVAGQIQFPGWLGKNSRASKMHRLCQEIHAHTRLSTSGSKSSIFLDYSPYLRDAIVTPLVRDRADGIPAAMDVLESYHLLREDLDSLTELSVWPGQRNPMVLIDSKVKAAMTRTYNKSATALPYAPAAIKKGRARDDDADGLEDDEPDEDEDSDPENDALIKKKKTNEKPSKEKSSTSKEKAGSSKEKASSTKEKAGSSKEKPSSSKGRKKK